LLHACIDLGANVCCVARVDINTSRNACAVETVYALIKAYIHTQQSGNSNHYIEMYEIFNPEIPGLEQPNPGIKKNAPDPGIRDWNP
jgi:hypothetical protein